MAYDFRQDKSTQLELYMLLERLEVTYKKLTILRLDEISILKPKNLKSLIIFFCIVDDRGLLLFGMQISLSSL